MENRISLYPSEDDRRTLRFGSVPGSVLHVSHVTGRDAFMVLGFGRFSENITNLISALERYIQLNLGATSFDPASRIIPDRRSLACRVNSYRSSP